MDSAVPVVKDINFTPDNPRPDIYHVEYNHLETRAQLPYIFCKKFIETVPGKVTLTDPVGNLFVVSITTDINHAYMDDGWNHVGSFYGLHEGGWITMYYISLGNFNIEVTNLLGDKVTYPPIPEPVDINDYDNPIVLDEDDDDLEDAKPIPLMVDRAKFITAVKKWLTFDEITGGTLPFSRSWCEYALPKSDGHLSLVDEYGKVWPCYYKANVGHGDVGGIHRGWKTFCQQKRLFQGQGVKFGVMRPNSSVLYFAPSA